MYSEEILALREYAVKGGFMSISQFVWVLVFLVIFEVIIWLLMYGDGIGKDNPKKKVVTHIMIGFLLGFIVCGVVIAANSRRPDRHSLLIDLNQYDKFPALKGEQRKD